MASSLFSNRLRAAPNHLSGPHASALAYHRIHLRTLASRLEALAVTLSQLPPNPQRPSRTNLEFLAFTPPISLLAFFTQNLHTGLHERDFLATNAPHPFPRRLVHSPVHWL